jgi:Domain of Unknown Function (DUF326)
LRISSNTLDPLFFFLIIIRSFLLLLILHNSPDIIKLHLIIKINRDCANICWTASQFMSRDSEYVKQICDVCADICEASVRKCERNTDMNHCQKCTQACRRCAEECRKVRKYIPYDRATIRTIVNSKRSSALRRITIILPQILCLVSDIDFFHIKPPRSPTQIK